MSKTFDIAIVGSGFAGSLLAMIARRLGHDVVLLERFKHPRFAIGESSTPLANLLLEEISTRYDLPRLLPLSKWGSWQRAYPEIACGLKRGFTFYHHTLGRPFLADPNRSDQLLVAASPHDGIADTHWYRADFDHFLVREAQQLGAGYFDEVKLNGLSWCADEAIIEGERLGRRLSLRARFVFDATGPRGFLHRALKLPERPFKNLIATQGLYSHFTGVRRLTDNHVGATGETPPYPVDDAAVHHVFDGGWIWVLRFNNGLTSAGVAATDELAHELNFPAGAQAWKRLLLRLPTVREQFAEAQPQFPFVHAPRLSFRSGIITGPGWALLPSAAGFVDPLLSTGFPLTLLGIARLAEAIEHHWGSPRFSSVLRTYEAETVEELATAERLVAALYSSLNDFPLFTSLSLLYFAAASYTEAARRLGRPQLAGSFLLNDRPFFSFQSRSCLKRAQHRPISAERTELMEQIQHAIEPFDIAGLGNHSRRNWHPVEARDLLNAAGKLGVSQEEIEKLLTRSGFFAPL